MTRKEAIKKWKDIVCSVFYAESKLFEKWNPQLRDARNMNGQERAQMADRYLEAIATEIVSGTSDEELERM